MSADMYEDDMGAADRRFGGTRRRLSGKKLVLYIVLPIVLIGGIVAGLYFSNMFSRIGGIIGGGGGAPVSSARQDRAPAADVVWFALPDILVNLRSDGPRPAFLKIKVNLELNTVADRAAVEKQLPRVIDTFQVYLRELRPDQLQGAAGMYRLREELLARVNSAVRPVQVREVLFTEIVVQ